MFGEGCQRDEPKGWLCDAFPFRTLSKRRKIRNNPLVLPPCPFRSPIAVGLRRPDLDITVSEGFTTKQLVELRIHSKPHGESQGAFSGHKSRMGTAM